MELFATLLPYLPAVRAGEPPLIEIAPGSTVDDVAALLGIPPEASRITLVNGRDATGEHQLREGDVVSMFPPLAGGREISRLLAARSG